MGGIDLRGLLGQRAVHVDVERRGKPPLANELVEDIEQVLRAAHGKGGDVHVPSPLEGRPDGIGKFLEAVFRTLVHAVPIGGLHHHVIGLVRMHGVLDDRVAFFPDVARKDDFLFRVAPVPQLEGPRSEDVPGIAEAVADHVVQGVGLVVLPLLEEGNGSDGVLDGIERLDGLFDAGPQVFPRHPLGVHLLDVGRVGQHDPGQFRRGGRRDDLAPEALPDQARDETRVVDVGMREKDDIDSPRVEREGLAVERIGIEALVHPAVHENLQAVDREVKTGTRDFSRRAEEGDLHGKASQSFERRGVYTNWTERNE